MKLLELYISASLSLEYLSNDLYSVLKNKNHIHANLKTFIDNLIQCHKSTYVEETLTAVVAETCQMLDVIYQELIDRQYYQLNGLLVFNTLWLESPDTFIFYRMDAEDVNQLVTR